MNEPDGGVRLVVLISFYAATTIFTCFERI